MPHVDVRVLVDVNSILGLARKRNMIVVTAKPESSWLK